MGADATSRRKIVKNGGFAPAAMPVTISWENKLKPDDNRSDLWFTPCCVMGWGRRGARLVMFHGTPLLWYGSHVSNRLHAAVWMCVWGGANTKDLTALPCATLLFGWFVWRNAFVETKSRIGQLGANGTEVAICWEDGKQHHAVDLLMTPGVNGCQCWVEFLQCLKQEVSGFFSPIWNDRTPPSEAGSRYLRWTGFLT